MPRPTAGAIVQTCKFRRKYKVLVRVPVDKIGSAVGVVESRTCTVAKHANGKDEGQAQPEHAASVYSSHFVSSLVRQIRVAEGLRVFGVLSFGVGLPT